jgi:hypothetical protein
VFLKVIYDWPKSAVRLGCAVPVAVALVGSSAGASLHCGADDSSWGTLVSQHSVRLPATPRCRCCGGLTGLGDAHGALCLHGPNSLHTPARHGLDMTAVLPSDFKWSVFIVALAMIGTPVPQHRLNMRRKEIA